MTSITRAPVPYALTSPAAASMVSQPFAPERALSVRRPPSVTSRSTTTRRHRSHRSHHGGSSYVPQNEFPNFAHTGDVEIIVAIDGQEKRYMLHRLILSQCSGFFEASTSEAWSRHQAQAHLQAQEETGNTSLSVIGEESDGSTISRTHSVAPISPGQKPMWRYELDTGNGESGSEDELPMLVQKPYQASMFGGPQALAPPPVRNKPPAPSNGFFRSMAAMQSAIHIPSSNATANTPESEIIRDYDNLFRIFYNYSPNLNNVDITEAYIQCKTLLTLADLYDALEVVGPRIDHHLLQFQSRLWKQIAKYPPSYLKLGYLARSKVIFSEALIHVVGQWPHGAPQLRSVPDSILDLIEDKVADLDDLKARVEGRLFRLNLTTARGDRVTPQNSYQDWLVVSFFRHWLGENLVSGTPPPIPKTSQQPSSAQGRHSSNTHRNGHTSVAGSASGTTLSSGRVFRLLGASGPAYLGHDEVKRFFKNRPEGDYSREGIKRFERRMEELKNMAHDVVKPLMRNFLELEGAGLGQGLGYLTCTKIEDADYPW